MRHVFALSTGRSGTRFLHGICQNNLRDAACRHEPYLTLGNPNMFGAPIDAHSRGDYRVIRQLLERKKRYVRNLRTELYVETSHAFLKSYYDLAPEYFENIRLVYLLRDPVKTAMSEANRERMLDRVHFPFRKYRGADGTRYYRWSLTGNEPIYQLCSEIQPTLFQWYLLQWIEIQNRAVAFLDQFQKHDDCVVLDSPRDLNDAGRLKDAFKKLDLPLRDGAVEVIGKQNQTPGAPTIISERDEVETDRILSIIPKDYLAIFRRPMFSRFAWTPRLLKHAAANPGISHNATVFTEYDKTATVLPVQCLEITPTNLQRL